MGHQKPNSLVVVGGVWGLDWVCVDPGPLGPKIRVVTGTDKMGTESKEWTCNSHNPLTGTRVR